MVFAFAGDSTITKFFAILRIFEVTNVYQKKYMNLIYKQINLNLSFKQL